MLLWCLSWSFAVPSFLGPDGVSYLGLGHGHHPRQKEIVVVDPKDGSLWIESDDGRIWKGDHWEGVDLKNTRYRFVQSQLTAVHEKKGKQLYFYNEQGQIALIRWSNGESARIQYHNDGRVARLDAGTGALWNFTWGRALIVQEEGRETLRISYDTKDEGYSLRVTAATGRTVESGYENNRLVYWVDPLGSKTELDWGKGLVKVRRDDGQLWQIGFDSDQNQTSLTFPDLSAWVWQRDTKGGLLSQIDPIGRIINFETDDQGSIVTTSSSLSRISYHRDGLGRLTKVDDALGVRFRLGWEEKSLRTIRDATDGLIQFVYTSTGKLWQIIDRSGGKWVFERDKDDLVVQIIAPDQSVWSLQRDRTGRVQQITTPFSVVSIDRNLQGLPTRLSLNGQEELAFVRDLVGNISAIQSREQVIQKWQWNALGEPTKVWTPQQTFSFERDRNGWLTSWADISCSRDSLGRILSVSSNSRGFSFVRDALGRIQTIQKEDYEIDITYDAHDKPIFWKESNGASSVVVRNERGQITKGDDVAVFYDAKGWLSKVHLNKQVWKWSRDVSGRVLQIISPLGSKIGFDRSASGILKFIRYPDNTMQRFFRTKDQLEVRIIGSDSTLLEQVWFLWNQYGLVKEKKKGDSRTFFRRDPNLDIVAVERSDGLIWSRTPDGIRDGMHGKAIFSFDGDVIGVQPPTGSYPYEKEMGYLAYHRDDRGRISEVIDVGIQGKFSYDPLDRLRSICFRHGCWKFFYDPRGMLSGFIIPGNKKQKLYWRPDLGEGEFHSPVLLSSGDYFWLQGPYGMIHSEDTDSSQHYIFDPFGKLLWMMGQEKVQPFSSLSLSYMGEVASFFGKSDELHIGAAGPVFRGDIAYEPFSNQRYDGSSFDKALYDEEFHRVPSLHFDQNRNEFWRDPLMLLSDLNIIPKMHHTLSSEEEELVQWLPVEYASKTNTGFHGEDLIWDEDCDPLIEFFLKSVFYGTSDPTTEEVIKHFFRAELDVFWGRSTLVEKIIWWNSETKLDPRLANIFFLD